MIHTHSGAHAPGHSNGHRGRWAAAALALLFSVVVAFVPGCGGGVGTGGTGSFSSGPIAGLGSIVVNGVRFDDSTASIQDDEGRSSALTLKEGMVVDVYSDAVTGTTGAFKATASTVRVNRLLRGPVTARYDAAAGTFSALGFVVKVSQSTVLDGLPSGLAALVVGSSRVEVHGYIDTPTGQVRATRVDVSSAEAPWELRAPVTAWTAGDSTFSVGDQRFNVSGIASLPGSLAVGSDVRVQLGSAQRSDGAWQVLSFGTLQRQLSDDHDAKVEGRINQLGVVSNGVRRAIISGVPVDLPLSVAPLSLGLGLGSRVEVEGGLVAGVLIATQLSAKPDSQDADEFEYHDVISSLSTSAQTFMLKGRTISYLSTSVRYKDGVNSAADLRDGLRVEVKCVRVGGVLTATEIKLDN
ncbi:MAG: hypothetical protein RJA98_1292 [Pseudomonadota bacterium]